MNNIKLNKSIAKYHIWPKFPNYNSIITTILIFVSCLIISGAFVYYFFDLNKTKVIISLILAFVLTIIFSYFNIKNSLVNSSQNNNISKEKKKFNFIDFILIIIYLLCLTANFYLLYASQTAESIISPWQVVSIWFFFIYALTSLILLLLIIRNTSKCNISYNTSTSENFLIFLISAFYFLSFSIAWLVYKINYGFDPLIHQTTMELIDKTGSVDPKPLYYLGQYSLLVIIHKLTNISIIWLDKLLVPLFAAIFLPIILHKVLIKWFSQNHISKLLILFLLIFPYTFFIITTPQNLSYLFLLLIILLGIICTNMADLILIYLLALAALTIQPIAGLPALLFAIFLTIFYSDNSKIKKYYFALIFILSSIILPISFYFLEKNIASNSENELTPFIFTLPKFIIPYQDNFIFNFIYLYGFNIKLIIGILILAGLYLAYYYKNKCKILIIHFVMSLALILSYFLTKKIPFNFLINYERDDYASRILLISAFFLLPFILIILHYLLNKLLQQNSFIKTIWLLFLILLLTTSVYLSYPRSDSFYNSHGYSVSDSDIKAVHWIENNKTSDYIVLANQQVSAAALREFGFNHYYHENIFYYPIPTGEQLYKYYLNMVYQSPSKETMKKAMDLAGVSQGFFILNKYWWQFPKILEQAKLSAQSWHEIDNGQIYIFKY